MCPQILLLSQDFCFLAHDTVNSRKEEESWHATARLHNRFHIKPDHVPDLEPATTDQLQIWSLYKHVAGQHHSYQLW